MTIICYSYFKSARGHCINRKMQYSTASTAVIVKALMGASGADANMRPCFRFIAPPFLSCLHLGQNIYTKVKYLSKKIRFKEFWCNHMIHNHSIPSPLKPKYITPPNEILMSVCSVCVCVLIWQHGQIYKNWNGNTLLCV